MRRIRFLASVRLEDLLSAKVTTLFALLTALVLLAGCGNKESPNATPMSDSTNQVKKEAQGAAANLSSQLAQTKDQAVAAVEKQLQALDAKVDELANRSKGYAGTAKTEADAALATLRTKREAAARKLEELRAASQETWQNVKASFDLTVQELEKTYNDLKSKFSN